MMIRLYCDCICTHFCCCGGGGGGGGGRGGTSPSWAILGMLGITMNVTTQNSTRQPWAHIWWDISCMCGYELIQCWDTREHGDDEIRVPNASWSGKWKANCNSDNTCLNYSGVIMSTMASRITGISIVHSTVCSGADQIKHQGVIGLCEGNTPVTG